MAASLGYTPPTPPDTAAQDEVDDLVRALHESGLLRALAGGARSYPRLLLARRVRPRHPQIGHRSEWIAS